uniref:F-box associated beta-propeller type 1 domain-containing protein n=1 Tax=Quercus lobata TaxID=97700 RepID=A0A7N2R996_QUELO
MWSGKGTVADLLACHARSVKNLVAWLEETLDIIMQLSSKKKLIANANWVIVLEFRPTTTITEDDIAPLLWNPSICKAIFLPTPEFPFSYMPMQYYGFGYDPTTDDYILVRVLYLEEEEGDDLKNDQLMVQIYTLGTGTWRNVTNPGPGSLSAFPENHLSVFVNGAVHWITSIEDDYIIYVILSFDRRNNSFHEMALPGSLDDVNKLNIKVAVVGFTKIGEVLVINTVNGELLSYNPSSQQISYIDIPAQLAPFYLDTYMESLPLLNVQDCASARRANELNLSNASKGKRKIC